MLNLRSFQLTVFQRTHKVTTVQENIGKSVRVYNPKSNEPKGRKTQQWRLALHQLGCLNTTQTH
ncbi:hypothetical protein BRADI_2g03195v3 [Brachypodium distachyon]|uniref:Uncharacterized protein n=1 Tax=Brachypodium distachyon TaxID=15368 RepID=A0A2K2D6M5_BRADI|nr:hypothetical protein BRADI_2g03195v3 [Brachypodium distachyon]PNT69936.1 hypothetical protein BRADI_2g03195v3 [Brachypodium distachyon]